ncbi:S41 family peptidase [Leucobacter sp. HNU]|uniref:S41 family peptidase n=1 Tax=Leucobacter sp. HNU TaxID=3236805 RepID=UPI003A808BB4
MRRLRRGTAVLVGVLVLGLAVGGAPAGDPGVRAYTDRALSGLQAGYYVDTPTWDEVLARELPVLRAAEATSDTHGALSRLVRAAGGFHSRFSTPEQAAASSRPGFPSSRENPTVRYDGRLGIVTVPGFSSVHADEQERYLRAAGEIFASEQASSACGWVIDVRHNGGGLGWAMILAVSPLLDDGTVEQFRTRDGRTSAVRVRDASLSWVGRRWDSLPAFAGRFGALDQLGMPGLVVAPALPGAPAKLPGRPIALVQSTRSASAAEMVLLAFAGQARTATFGAESAGYTTLNGGFMLPDGAEVTLSFALMGDRDGNFHEGAIPPDHPVDPEDDSALEAARGWALQQCAGGSGA